MKKTLVLILTLAALPLTGLRAADDAAAAAEKQKALANPYANDLGPAELPAATLASYPAEAQAGYKLLLVKCAKCHTPSRPLNSQFVEVPGKKEEKDAKLAALRKSEPQLFAAKHVWQVETGIWQRYVKRMMAKPGCEIAEAEGKAIYKFLAHDSSARKTGKNAAIWKAKREKLLADFKVKFPAKYTELYEKKP
jgi:mono/diheme cytochrome c family protein